MPSFWMISSTCFFITCGKRKRKHAWIIAADVIAAVNGRAGAAPPDRPSWLDVDVELG
jgi:hypothetical protein